MKIGTRTSAILTATASLIAITMSAAPAQAQQAEDCSAYDTQAERDACAERVNTTVARPDSVSSDDGAIVVTGSRIRKSEFNSPDPIQIINPELGQKQG